MFNETNIIEFINKIINESNEDEKELKNNIEKFKEYLILTKMSNLRITEWLNQVIICLPEILVLKKKLNNINVSSLIDINEIKVSEENISKEDRKILTKKFNEKINIEKHYHHYETSSTSSNCGGGSTTRRGC